MYDEPDARFITPEQKSYISSYIYDFESALASENFQDELNGYKKYIDVGNFIDFFLINELTNNVDGYRLSTFIHKDKGAKLRMGPFWDFNLALGNADYCGGGGTNVWAYQFNQRCKEDFWQVPFWWERFLEDPEYLSLLKVRWFDLRQNAFSFSTIERKIDAYSSLLEGEGAIEENFLLWPILSEYVWPNNYIGGSYEAEIQYLKDWISQRLQWLDSQIENL